MPDVNGVQAAMESKTSPAVVRIRHSYWLSAVASVALVALVTIGVVWWRTPPAPPVVESVTQLTADGQPKSNLLSDGVRLYVNEGAYRAAKIVQVPVNRGPAATLETPVPSPYLRGLARDGSSLLAWSDAGRGAGNESGNGAANLPSFALWSIPLPAGKPRRLLNPQVGDADFFPDGRLAFAQGKDAFVADKDGSHPRKLVSFQREVRRVAVSPDGRRVLLTVDAKNRSYAGLFDTLEMAANGSGLREIRTASPDECCFTWGWDGRYLLYSSRAVAGKRWDIWAVRFKSGLSGPSKRPVRLTNGPQTYPGGAIQSRDGKQIFAIGSEERAELVRYDMKLHQFVPLLSGSSAVGATYSKDGRWVAYASYPDHTLWRSRSDGTQRRQLTYPPVEVWEPSISPDGTKVAFDSISRTSSAVCVIDMNGGPPRTIFEKGSGPHWSPDGSSIVAYSFGPRGNTLSLQTMDMRTGKTAEIPLSGNERGAFWLDRETLGALSDDGTKLVTFDLKTKRWSDLLTGSFVSAINSPDGKYVYFATGGAEPSVQRIRVADRHMETIASLKDFTRVVNFGWTQLRVAPDGSPTLTRAVDSQEIYALNIR